MPDHGASPPPLGISANPAPDSALHTVHLHSCERMPEMPDNSVALTVTSPPYWNAIDYERHQSEPRSNYRPRQPVDYESYLDRLVRCFREVFRVQRPGGFCAVVIGTVLLDGRHTPLPFHLVLRMEAAGWQFHQDIVWAKITGGVKRARLAVRYPYPGYFYPNLMTEYILIFRKPGGAPIYSGRTPAEKERSRVSIDSIFTREVANNVWHIAPVPPRQFDHPCPFPEEIPHRLIRWFSYAGEVVLDPFCGIGTTLKAAAGLGRRWVGYEISARYAQRALVRVAEPMTPRRQLIVRVEHLGYGETRRPRWHASAATARKWRRSKTAAGERRQ